MKKNGQKREILRGRSRSKYDKGGTRKRNQKDQIGKVAEHDGIISRRNRKRRQTGKRES